MPEIQDIFQQYGQDFRRKHKLPGNVRKAMSAIEHCRTSLLGGHMDTCDECGYSRISYNSCRNRHCPKTFRRLPAADQTYRLSAGSGSVCLCVQFSQNEEIKIAHTGIMFEKDDFGVFVEKTDPMLPFQMTKFKNKYDLYNYLVNRVNKKPVRITALANDEALIE